MNISKHQATPLVCPTFFFYKREFIGSAHMIGGWVVPQWLSAHWRSREPGSSSVQESEILITRGPKQSQSKAEGLKAP
jgi:hypothetical protein